MRQYTTFAQNEALLLTAIGLLGNSIQTISAKTGILPNTLYKWKNGTFHLSPQKADKLLLYFMAEEPKRLEIADTILQQT